MRKEIRIKFHWWNDEQGGIDPAHAEALEELAIDQIMSMAKEGYTSGELNDSIRLHDTDPEEGVKYRGHWEMRQVTL